MLTIASANPIGGAALPAPGAAIGAGNISNATKLAEKTIELTTCAQFGHHFAARMVWFGLTQKQERQYGFDAATDLGGNAFILQFKVSATVLMTGTYAGQRRFAFQHQQMQKLRTGFGGVHNCCFYFLPDLGTFADLTVVGGDLLANSFLVDVADLPAAIPATHRVNGYHYAYLDNSTPELTITSESFKPKKIMPANDFIRLAGMKKGLKLTSVKRLVALAREFDRTDERLADMFFKNAALAVLL